MKASMLVASVCLGIIGGGVTLPFNVSMAAPEIRAEEPRRYIYVKYEPTEYPLASVESEIVAEPPAPIIPEVVVPEAPEIEEEEAAPTVVETASRYMPLPYCATYTGMKCCESYKALTARSSTQYKLQQKAYTDECGFRKIDDRYLVAIGTYFKAECGTYFDIILENGTVIPAIVGDIKADIHTEENNVYSAGKCATEFIADLSLISKEIWSHGDASWHCDMWKSKVKALRVFCLNYFDDKEKI